MLTLQKIHNHVKRLSETYIPKAKQRRFLSGIQTLSLQEFSSLNRAGRQLSPNRLTGETRIRRAVKDSELSRHIRQLIIREVFAGRMHDAFCSLDHSQFGPFCIAVLALSERHGRAIPIWCQVNVSEAALIAPLVTALEELFAFVRSISPRLKLILVMDRWFSSEKLMRLISGHGQYFIARSKGDKLVQLAYDPSWWREPLGDISSEELPITYHGLPLRFVRSDWHEGMKDDEPWFLLTNLPDRARSSDWGYTRRQILNRYAERFEIEEAFKDIKWLQRLKWQQVKRAEVIESLLHFMFLGWWLLWILEGEHTPKKVQREKQRLSWFRTAWEKLQLLSRPPELCFIT